MRGELACKSWEGAGAEGLQPRPSFRIPPLPLAPRTCWRFCRPSTSSHRSCQTQQAGGDSEILEGHFAFAPRGLRNQRERATEGVPLGVGLRARAPCTAGGAAPGDAPARSTTARRQAARTATCLAKAHTHLRRRPTPARSYLAAPPRQGSSPHPPAAPARHMSLPVHTQPLCRTCPTDTHAPALVPGPHPHTPDCACPDGVAQRPQEELPEQAVSKAPETRTETRI